MKLRELSIGTKVQWETPLPDAEVMEGTVVRLPPSNGVTMFAVIKTLAGTTHYIPLSMLVANNK